MLDEIEAIVYSGTKLNIDYFIEEVVDDDHVDDIYDASWIEDEPLWRFEALKKLGVKLEEKDFPNIKQIIDSTIESTEFSNGRKEISLQAWQNKGKCASSTVDYLLEVQKTVLNSLK